MVGELTRDEAALEDPQAASSADKSSSRLWIIARLSRSRHVEQLVLSRAGRDAMNPLTALLIAARPHVRIHQ